jgi:hypothetical protein
MGLRQKHLSHTYAGSVLQALMLCWEACSIAEHTGTLLCSTECCAALTTCTPEQKHQLCGLEWLQSSS